MHAFLKRYKTESRVGARDTNPTSTVFEQLWSACKKSGHGMFVLEILTRWALYILRYILEAI